MKGYPFLVSLEREDDVYLPFILLNTLAGTSTPEEPPAYLPGRKHREKTHDSTLTGAQEGRSIWHHGEARALVVG